MAAAREERDATKAGGRAEGRDGRVPKDDKGGRGGGGAGVIVSAALPHTAGRCIVAASKRGWVGRGHTKHQYKKAVGGGGQGEGPKKVAWPGTSKATDVLDETSGRP